MHGPSVDHLITDVLKREGGYVNDPADSGGPTKYGITQATLRAWRKRRVTAKEVKALTLPEARRIYKRQYFERPGIASLPAPLQAPVFDMYVNGGSRAVKLLQKTLGRFGEALAQDGVIGPMTIAAAQRAVQKHGAGVVNAYGMERRDFYYRLADRRPKDRKYACTRKGGKGGWIKRAEEFMHPSCHLSLADHRRRIAHW